MLHALAIFFNWAKPICLPKILGGSDQQSIFMRTFAEYSNSLHVGVLLIAWRRVIGPPECLLEADPDVKQNQFMLIAQVSFLFSF
ncbi:hypothetical protein ACOSQ3_010317 [Xanthoceras sorbifolium]